MENKRICTICLIEKDFSDFYWDKRFNIPFSRCKICYKKKCEKYRKSKHGKLVFNRWKNSERGKKVVLAKYKRWLIKHEIQRKAVYTVNNAIRDGRLIRQPCEVCGNLKSEAHHVSYEEKDWLGVIWLCRLHHYEIHHKK